MDPFIHDYQSTMFYQNQQTLQRSFRIEGVGLHSGHAVSASVHPAPIHTGIQFRRIDLPGRQQVRASIEHIIDVSLASTLGVDGERIATIEHLMAALLGLGIDNALVEVDGPEIPVLDGSSIGWAQAIRGAGIRVLPAPRRQLRILRKVRVESGDKWAEVNPSENGLTLDCAIDFAHPLIGRQRRAFTVNPGGFLDEIAASRTFGFLHEVDAMRARGLALGGSTSNAIVLTPHGLAEGSDLRWNDEFIRHKILDTMGDLYLLGGPMSGTWTSHKSGHALNLTLVQAILAEPANYVWEPQRREMQTVRRAETVQPLALAS